MAPTATSPAPEAAPTSSPAPSKWLNEKFTHIIGGKQYDQPNAKWVDVINPATEEPVARIPAADQATVDLAVATAQEAFQQWKTTTREDRAARITAWYEESYKPLCKTDVLDLLIAEQGRNRQLAEFEFMVGVPPFFKVEDHPVIEEEVVISKKQDPDGTVHSSVQKAYPLGVVAGLIPWNYPIVLALWKVIPALLTGNCIIVKPSPFTPLATLKVMMSAQAHFPPGVLQVVVGDDSLGVLLSEHPRIQCCHFTGSTATARAVLRSCAATMKKCVIEAGGNDVAVVLAPANRTADAKIDEKTDANTNANINASTNANASTDVRSNNMAEIALQVFIASLQNSGQFCAAAKRIFVHESIYDEFAKAFVDIVKASPMGNGAVAGTAFGPVATYPQRKKVEEFILDIQNKKHNVLTGGELVPGTGYFVQPTVVDNPPDSSKIVAEEPFGPIVPLLKWKDEDELIARANDTIYGLGASIWGDDNEMAQRIADRLETGTVWINQLQSFDPKSHFGGWKQSGLGGCHGRLGMENFCRFKTIKTVQKPAKL